MGGLLLPGPESQEEGGICRAEPLAQITKDFIDRLREKTNPEIFIQTLRGANLMGTVDTGEKEPGGQLFVLQPHRPVGLNIQPSPEHLEEKRRGEEKEKREEKKRREEKRREEKRREEKRREEKRRRRSSMCTGSPAQTSASYNPAVKPSATLPNLGTDREAAAP
ncbi:hypothetical protein llap_17626 [Limosa lapponica baueri]|uniref:Uncharacterized protein n=1 Tax=Limosa lapponica baueri TaxID=1758121 RepID=A0A2I0TE48_LIMLA|nr:hypothetical protein llap_17626 [Limosa lapponica baueri]